MLKKEQHCYALFVLTRHENTFQGCGLYALLHAAREQKNARLAGIYLAVKGCIYC